MRPSFSRLPSLPPARRFETSRCSLLVFLLSAIVLGAAGPAAASSASDCRTTALVDRLPNVVAPMAGKDPIWLLGAAQTSWSENQAVDAAFVLSRRHDGELTVIGRRRKSPSELSFVGENGVSRVLQVAEPHRSSVVPPGASSWITKEYSFVPTRIVFPTHGCWEIDARLGDATRRIVVWVPRNARPTR